MIPRFLSLTLCVNIACFSLRPAVQNSEPYSLARHEMVQHQLAGRDISDSRVLEVMGKVPRHEFLPESMRHYSYVDSPVPIGFEQTISQPYIVALMTQLVRPKPEDRALEIGTGSGYQAAVLAGLVKEVFTIEIVPELADRAAETLERLGYHNVKTRSGDGYAGWEEEAPFNIVLITAAAPRIPEPLLEQLAEGGRLVLPVGPPGGYQELILIEKQKGKARKKTIIPVRFVPMTGQIQN